MKTTITAITSIIVMALLAANAAHAQLANFPADYERLTVEQAALRRDEYTSLTAAQLARDTAAANTAKEIAAMRNELAAIAQMIGRLTPASAQQVLVTMAVNSCAVAP